MREVVLKTPQEARCILEEMKKILSRFGYVTIADLYELADLTPDYEDERRGWRELHAAKIVAVGGHYLLDFPAAEDVVFSWTKRAIQHGSGIVPRVLTEQYIQAMKALGYDSVHLVLEGNTPKSTDERYGRNNGKVFCGREGCIVDSDEKTGFYMVHRGECPLNDLDFPGAG